jgi:biotin synthase
VRYRLSKEQILEACDEGYTLGFRTFVMQGGEDPHFDDKTVCDIVSSVKEKYPECAITLSIGEKPKESYKAFKNAGADRYLLRIETTDKDLYTQMHPYMDFDNRIRCLKDLKTLGYEVGTGCLVGLPNQTVESLADDILFFNEIGADMVGIGPFIPHPNTPLKDFKTGDFTLALKVMALTRIIMKDINIPATTAMETLNPNGRIIALQSGANVVMPNVTTREYRAKYEIYPGKICVNEEPSQCRHCIEAKIKSIGRFISQTKGFHKK